MTDKAVPAHKLANLIQSIFESEGMSAADAECVADSLVSADLEGVASHGVSLVPMYVQRLRAGSVAINSVPQIVEDYGGLVIISAANTFGQVSSQAAVKIAIERSGVHGISMIAVRDAFHFGAAAYWAKKISKEGMVGFAFSNTRPLMPPPGGAERMVGNNPMAIAFPSASGGPLVVDMAMSATAMGKIRLAEAQGLQIPEGWATDSRGNTTTSPAEAIKGMLLPAAGPKGFGLAVAIDLLCGALSGGGFGASVRPLYDQLDQSYNCSHAFIAINARRVNGGSGINDQVAAFAHSIRSSSPAEGVERIYAPGDLERFKRQQLAGNCSLTPALATALNELAERARIELRL